MSFENDFSAGNHSPSANDTEHISPAKTIARKSLVTVKFPDVCYASTYYNDTFDLMCGSRVFVEGKFANKLGEVTDINYNFKVKRADYKRVISVVNPFISGDMLFVDSYAAAFDKNVLSPEKVRSWFLPPLNDDEYISGNDNSSFPLNDLSQMEINRNVADRGYDYYRRNCVKFISLDGTHGYAIVDNGSPYEVEFEYRNGVISALNCTCPCTYNCKHEYAAMLLLDYMLHGMEDVYDLHHKENEYFAVVAKDSLFKFTITAMNNGIFTIKNSSNIHEEPFDFCDEEYEDDDDSEASDGVFEGLEEIDYDRVEEEKPIFAGLENLDEFFADKNACEMVPGFDAIEKE